MSRREGRPRVKESCRLGTARACPRRWLRAAPRGRPLRLRGAAPAASSEHFPGGVPTASAHPGPRLQGPAGSDLHRGPARHMVAGPLPGGVAGTMGPLPPCSRLLEILGWCQQLSSPGSKICSHLFCRYLSPVASILHRRSALTMTACYYSLLTCGETEAQSGQANCPRSQLLRWYQDPRTRRRPVRLPTAGAQPLCPLRPPRGWLESRPPLGHVLGCFSAERGLRSWWAV